MRTNLKLVIFCLAHVLAGLPIMAGAANPFGHPGMLHSKSELAFIKEKLSSGEEPWKSAWLQLRSAKGASLSYTPNPSAKVIRGVRNNPNIGSSDMSNDAAAVYAHALQWSLTGNQAHATKAIEILNVWSGTLKSVEGHDAKLLVGMDGVSFCNAAELIRHTSDQWPEPDQKQFERMLRDVFYPTIKDFFPTANGNWDASMIQTMIAMGIFLDDRAMFEKATTYFLSGKGNGAITKYLNHFGECQESGRDQVHTQMGLGYLSCACEMAWKQGLDLYGAAENRLALGFEYTAKYNLGEDVPYEPFRSVEGRYSYKKNLNEIPRTLPPDLRTNHSSLPRPDGSRDALQPESCRSQTPRVFPWPAHFLGNLDVLRIATRFASSKGQMKVSLPGPSFTQPTPKTFNANENQLHRRHPVSGNSILP